MRRVFAAPGLIDTAGMHRPALLVVASLALFACDSGKPADAGAKVEVAADAKAGAAVQGDAKAGAEVEAAVPAVVVAGAVGAELRPVAEVEAAIGTKISLAAADLDLAGVARLVATGKLRAAAELELLLNAPGTAAHRVDLDADGKLDYVQVVELRAGSAMTFELRAVPSSKLDASLAVLLGSIVVARADAGGAVKAGGEAKAGGGLVVSASYAAAVAGGADFEFSQDVAAEIRGDVVTVTDASAGAFLAWTFTAGRPVYVSTHVSTADIQLTADGAAHFGADASARLDAAQLAALRAELRLTAPKISVDAKADAGLKAGAKAKSGAKAESGAKAQGGVKVEHSAKAESSAKAEGGGFKVGGSVKVGGGASIGGGGKAGGGIKIGK
jgi:hypothetical protein